jgi:N-dimethylarginine dimethylaminohydrolase
VAAAPRELLRCEYLMCAPHFLSNAVPNNPMMADLARHFPQVDRAAALAQFEAVRRFVCRYAHVQLLPPVDGLQDLTYVSNLGICVHGAAVFRRRGGSQESRLRLLRWRLRRAHQP